MDRVFECEDEGDDHENDVNPPGKENRLREDVPARTKENGQDISGLRRDKGNDEDRDVHTQIIEDEVQTKKRMHEGDDDQEKFN